MSQAISIITPFIDSVDSRTDRNVGPIVAGVIILIISSIIIIASVIIIACALTYNYKFKFFLNFS